jgi:hypothetical protein
MKIITVSTVFLIFTVVSCDFILGYKPKGVQLINNSSQNIYVLSGYDSLKLSYNPFLDQKFEIENEKGVKISEIGNPNLLAPNDSTGVTDYFWGRNNKSEPRSVIIISEDLKNKYSWKELVTKQLYTKRYIFTSKQAEKIKWRIVYP